jgi:hypothetical protein
MLHKAKVSKEPSAVLTRVPLAIHRTVLAECPKHLCCSCFGARGRHCLVDYGYGVPNRENGSNSRLVWLFGHLDRVHGGGGVVVCISAINPRRRGGKGSLMLKKPSSVLYHRGFDRVSKAALEQVGLTYLL